MNPYALQTLRERLSVPLLVDAGWACPIPRLPGHGMGLDGVLLNTAVALAQDPWPWPVLLPMPVQAGWLPTAQAP